MKKITYLLLFMSAFTFVSCLDDYVLEDGGLAVTDLPGYVAFNAPGASVSIDDISTAENGGTENLNVEIPTGTLSDVTVNFSFSGTAVFGVDFNVAGASSSGGSVTIVHDPTDFLFFDNADIAVEMLTDDVVDGTKTLTITLTSASNAEGDIAVGRGGTDVLKARTITIADFCELSPATIVGDWGLVMQDSFGDGWNGASVTFEIDGVETDYVLDDFTTDGGSTGETTITVPAGAATLRFFFNSGDFDEEITFQIISPGGNEVGSYGVSPAAGEFGVDACAL